MVPDFRNKGLVVVKKAVTTVDTSNKKLGPKPTLFAKEYLIDLNATQAAIRAGYSAKTAQEQSSRLLSNVMVQQAIQLEMDKRAKKIEITADKVLNEIARLAFFDPRKFFNSDGSPIPIQDLDDDTAMALSGIDVLEEYEGTGKDRVFVGYTKKFKLADKKANLELLGRHLKLFGDTNTQVNVNVQVANVIRELDD